MTATPSHHRRPTSLQAWAPWASFVSLLATVVVTTVLFAIGAWRRRWMSDDGLIVLRTVRNLLAGNGPVFNAGERVETNTSTLWQYLIYVGAKLTDARLEAIAMWLALVLSVAALAIATATTGLLWRRARTGAGRTQLILPFGALVYLALPPARDFATSGLEWGLSIFWLAVLWALSLWWIETRPGADEPESFATWVLAFWVGLSWLVRPELVLYGGVFGLVLLFGAANWSRRAMILLVAAPVPLAYQIFRMGYYGLLTPHTAVAKSASDAMWGTGWAYIEDLANPYAVWFGLAMVLLVAGLALGFGPQAFVARSASWQHIRKNRVAAARSAATITTAMIVVALLHFAYVIRVGGDFMHGRMALIPLFALLLPVMCLPVFDLRPTRLLTHWPVAVLSLAGFVGLVCWSWMTVDGAHKGKVPADLSAGKVVVDERSFYAQFTGVERPLYATDFAHFERMTGYTKAIATYEEDGQVGMMVPIRTGVDDNGDNLYGWLAIPRNKYAPQVADAGSPTTVWFTNLGMTSALAPLDVRVLDQIGLANPLAARTERMEDGRIGHDKNLPLEWGVADSPVYVKTLPRYMNQELVLQAEHAQKTEGLQQLVATYREPMSAQRFLTNIKFSLTDGRTLEVDGTAEEYVDLPEVADPIHWSVNVQLDEPR